MILDIARTVKSQVETILPFGSVLQQPLANHDYGVLKQGPQKIIRPDGSYEPGWFEEFEGEHNFDEASGSSRRFQKWFHIHFETPEYFIVANIADLGLGGNIALLVHHKASGETAKSSKTHYLVQNKIKADSKNRHFRDPATESEIQLNEDGEVYFTIHTPELTLQGVAESCMGKPFAQSTVYSEGMGTVQWWGNLQLREGHLVMNGEMISLPKGAFGAYDRTVGHRPQKQNWNWLSVVGDAVDEESGESIPFSLQVSKERERAEPRIDSKKYNLWLGDELRKFTHFTMEYTSHPLTKKSGNWSILGVGGDDYLNLKFEPRTHRREEKWLPMLLEVDFNQYYGVVSGCFTRDGRRYRVESTFAVAEDSRMNFKV